MDCKIKNITPGLLLNVSAYVLFLVMQFSANSLSAQDKRVAVIKLSFSKTDSTKIVTATVISADSSLPVKETEVHLYVKRMYSLLPVGKVVATDENGEAAIDFPGNLPGDKNDMLVVIAKIEHNENYADVETQSTVKWGIPNVASSEWSHRSLAASREKAPMVLVIASSLIIAVIWGTIFYVIFQLVRIKKSGNSTKGLTVADS